METDPRVLRHYELGIESERLWRPGVGELVRRRTWDIFERYLPPEGRIADVGGGPGTHATHLLDRGYEVVIVEPVPRLLDQAKESTGGRAEYILGDARQLDLNDRSFDAVLLMGPLYHLPEPADRHLALQESARILRSGGRLLSEVITRHLWLLDATAKGSIADPDVRSRFEVNLQQGLSTAPERLADGGFYAYLHDVGEIRGEVEAAGFVGPALIGVEGHAWLLDNLERLLDDPAALLDVLRLIEHEPSLLGVSAHIITAASKP